MKTAELDPRQNYLVGFHPHGVLAAGAFINFCTEASGFSTLFPGITPHLMMLSLWFRFPFFRDYVMSGGKDHGPMASSSMCGSFFEEHREKMHGEGESRVCFPSPGANWIPFMDTAIRDGNPKPLKLKIALLAVMSVVQLHKWSLCSGHHCAGAVEQQNAEQIVNRNAESCRPGCSCISFHKNYIQAWNCEEKDAFSEAGSFQGSSTQGQRMKIVAHAAAMECGREEDVVKKNRKRDR